MSAINLTSLRRPAGVIEIDGKKHDVLKLNGRQRQRIVSADTPLVPDAYEVVAELVPTLAADGGHLALDADQVNAILLLAGQGLAAVEAMFPNGASPETPTSPG
jgi:hypothetical protein